MQANGLLTKELITGRDVEAAVLRGKAALFLPKGSEHKAVKRQIRGRITMVSAYFNEASHYLEASTY
jgi:hypothetical protein